jgi:hypothetical protein
MRLAVLLLLLPLAAAGQEEHELAARRAILERDQQSAAFALQLRQSQAGVAPDLAWWQQRQQEALHAGPLARPLQPELAERERRAQALRFGREPSWGPVLDDLGNGTPRRRWTPTLESGG